MSTRPLRAALLVLAACRCSGSDPVAPSPDAPRAPPDAAAALPPLPTALLVASRGSDVVLRFDGAGAFLATAAADAALVRPVGITLGPDGNLYVAVGDTERVLRFDARSGASLGTFTRDFALQSPRNLNFGPDGQLYVADGFLDQILRFDGATGAFDRVFVDDPALRGPTSFTFGPDGHLHVVSVLSNRVLRFDGSTGALLGELVTSGLTQPHDVSFGPDGNLYVTNSGSTVITRYRADTGAPLGAFVSDGSLRNALGMAWGPDGHLYVANQGRNEILRYDGASGARLGAFVAAGAGGLTAPAFLAFEPPAAPTLTATPRSGGVLLAASGLPPGARTLLLGGAASGTSTIPECPGVTLDLGGATVVDRRIADESGATVAAVPAAAAYQAVALRPSAACVVTPRAS